MKENKRNFVEEYKVILDLKKNLAINKYKSIATKNTSSIFLIVVTIYIGFGYLFNIFNNIHYQIVSIFIILISCFIVFNHTKEIIVINKLKEKYNPLHGYLYELLSLITIISLFNVIVILSFYSADVNILLTILLSIISIVSYLVSLRYFDIVATSETSFLNPLFKAGTLALLYMCLNYITDFTSITFDYILFTAILTILVIVHSTKVITVSMSNVSILFRLLLFIFFFVFALYISGINEAERYYEYNMITTPTNFNEDINSLFKNGDYIYSFHDETLYEYDQNLNLIREIHPEFDDIILFYYFDIENNLKAVVKNPVVEPFGEIYTVYNTIQYDLSDVSNPVEEMSFHYVFLEYGIPYILDYNGSKFITGFTNQYIYMSNNQYGVYGDEDLIDFEEVEVLFKNEEYFIFVNPYSSNNSESMYLFKSNANNYTSMKYASYSNDKILTYENIDHDDPYYDYFEGRTQYAHITDYRTAINENYDEYLISYEFSYDSVDLFLYDDEHYFINVFVSSTTNYSHLKKFSDGTLYIYDDEYNLVANVENSGELFFTDDLIYQVQYDDDSNPIEHNIIDRDNMYTETLIEIDPLDTISLVTLIILLLSFNMYIPGLDIYKKY